MKAFEGDRTLMRIFIGEGDRCTDGSYKGMPLYQALLQMLREHGCASASVVQGIAGFGASARIHTGSLLRLSMDLPINAISGERCNPHPHNFTDRLLRPGDQAFFDILQSFNGYRTCAG